MSAFTHFDEAGNAVMVDVTGKAATERVAIASGRVLMRPETLALIERRAVAKGDVLTVSQNSRSRSTRLSGALPAMIAALIAPIEIPATQFG